MRKSPGMTWLLPVFMLACGGGVNGVYEPENGEGFFEKLDFRGSGKVDITFIGSIREADFEVDGDRVRITTGGETQIFTRLDDGCLDGGGLLGRYCRS